MADIAPPPGPPPPKVPAGWKAQWNAQYNEWFYVNIYTKQSQWERPTEPIYPPSDSGAPPGPPPTYNDNRPSPVEKGSNNPYLSASSPGSRGPSGSSSNITDDEAYARRLQAEENARAQGRPLSRDAQQDYMNTPMPAGAYDQQPSPGLPPRPQERGKGAGGFLGKLLGKHSGSSGNPSYGQYGSPGPQQYGAPQQQYGYGSPAPQQYGGYPPPQQQGYYGGGGGGYQQAPPKKSGMSAGAGAALGLGGGLVGGMLLEDAIQDHDQNEYQQGYDQGYDQGDDNGGYDDGGDYGGGDF